MKSKEEILYNKFNGEGKRSFEEYMLLLKKDHDQEIEIEVSKVFEIMEEYASQQCARKDEERWIDANLEWPKKDGAHLCRFNESIDIYEIGYWNKEKEMWEFEGVFFNCNFYSHWQEIKPPAPPVNEVK